MEHGLSPLLLREVNDRAFGVLRSFGSEEGDFACECGERDCCERVELLLIEYAARDDRPLLATGHRQAAPALS